MREFFISIFHWFRDIDKPIKIIMTVVAFLLAFFFLSLSIRKKNERSPLAWGWFILCLLCGFFAVACIIW